MNTRSRLSISLAAAVFLVLVGCADKSQSADGGAPEGWGSQDEWFRASESDIHADDFVAGVDNPYWPLVPGTKWVYEAETSEGTERIEVEVLAGTREVMGVPCVVVRDTVMLDGVLVEDTRDWYAQDKDGNVWYMGEEVKNYEDGVLVNSVGAWEAGVDGALPGIKMWAEPRVGGAPYYQEYYEGEAEDLGRDIEEEGMVTVPFGRFEDLLVVEEWTPLEPDIVELKYYAFGVGTVMEEKVRGGEEAVELVDFQMP